LCNRYLAKLRRLAAVDVGVINLALAFGTVNDGTVTITRTALVDTTQPCTVAGCPLHHTGMAVDRVAHVVAAYRADFDAAEVVVIERQPPGGLRDVEQVFAATFRAKCVVMAPQTMHATIGSSGLAYEARKEVSKATAAEFTDLTPYRKQDDVADAVCLLLTQAAKWRRGAPNPFARFASTDTTQVPCPARSEKPPPSPPPSLPCPPPSPPSLHPPEKQYRLIVRSRYWTNLRTTRPTT
jgi:hypothetical protein